MPQSSNRIPLVKVSIRYLRENADNVGVIRIGATVDPETRAYQYYRDGYRGEMYYAETTNMKRAENLLLAANDTRHNVHEVSNADDSPGYVYFIQGQRRRN